MNDVINKVKKVRCRIHISTCSVEDHFISSKIFRSDTISINSNNTCINSNNRLWSIDLANCDLWVSSTNIYRMVVCTDVNHELEADDDRVIVILHDFFTHNYFYIVWSDKVINADRWIVLHVSVIDVHVDVIRPMFCHDVRVVDVITNLSRIMNLIVTIDEDHRDHLLNTVENLIMLVKNQSCFSTIEITNVICSEFYRNLDVHCKDLCLEIVVSNYLICLIRSFFYILFCVLFDRVFVYKHPKKYIFINFCGE